MANPEGRHGAQQVLCEVDGFAVELSPDHLRPSGAFVPTTAPQPLDAEITLTLHSPVGDAVLRALVVQVITREQAAQSGRAAGYGVLFLDLVDDQRAFIGLTLDALDRAQRAEIAARSRRRMSPSRPRQRIQSTPLEPPHNATRKRKLCSEGTEALRRLRAELEKLPTRSPFAVLGLEPDADAEATRNAFLAISKRCHPHVFARYDNPEINTAATDLFIAYKRAYALARNLARPTPSASPGANAVAKQAAARDAMVVEPLPTATPIPIAIPFPSAPVSGRPVQSAQPALKQDAPNAVSNRPSSPPPAQPSNPSPASPPPAARALAQQLGHALPPRPSIPVPQRGPVRERSAAVVVGGTAPALRGGAFRSSQPTRAANVSSDRPQDGPRRTIDTEVTLGSALKHLAGSRFDQAELELEHLCALRPGQRDSQVWLHVCRARKLKAERKPDAAVEHYRAVLALDPEHREALDHVGRARKRGGLVGKWFAGDDE